MSGKGSSPDRNKLLSQDLPVALLPSPVSAVRSCRPASPSGQVTSTFRRGQAEGARERDEHDTTRAERCEGREGARRRVGVAQAQTLRLWCRRLRPGSTTHPATYRAYPPARIPTPLPGVSMITTSPTVISTSPRGGRERPLPLKHSPCRSQNRKK